MVGPGDCTPDPKVEVKLADYGISRLSLPTGAKGFGGTEGYIIQRHEILGIFIVILNISEQVHGTGNNAL
jgi:hypothetical protein